VGEGYADLQFAANRVATKEGSWLEAREVETGRNWRRQCALAEVAHSGADLMRRDVRTWPTLEWYLGRSATSSLWVAHSEEQEQDRQRSATVVALAAIRPKDELEGMMAAQLVAAHNATMECYRRAMLPEQTSEGRSENLNQASKLSRTYGVLLDALNRHRGKGQQKVTVEHIHVHSGGQAVVGMVGAPGEGEVRRGPTDES
jgi:hypothetical protein